MRRLLMCVMIDVMRAMFVVRAAVLALLCTCAG